MAEPIPGQVITPGGPSEPPKDSSQASKEVSVNLSQHSQPQQPLPVAPAPVAPPAPQPPAPAPVLQNQPPSVAPPAPVQQPAPVAQPQPSSEAADTSAPFTQAAQNPAPPASNFAFQAEDGMPESFSEVPQPQIDSPEAISWTASEYIAHQKTQGWYAALAGIALAIIAATYFITGGDIISVVVILFAIIMFGVYAGKNPKEQRYAIGPAGITIGSKTYGFDVLKTFSISDEGPFSSITFWPLKRFMPAISIYYDPQDEDKIVNTLSNYLPLDPERQDIVENFMRKIRF